MQYKDVPMICNEQYDLISVLYHALEGAWKWRPTTGMLRKLATSTSWNRIGGQHET